MFRESSRLAFQSGVAFSVIVFLSQCILRITRMLQYSHYYTSQVGHAVAQLFEAPRYKLEGRGFDSR